MPPNHTPAIETAPSSPGSGGRPQAKLTRASGAAILSPRPFLRTNFDGDAPDSLLNLIWKHRYYTLIHRFVKNIAIYGKNQDIFRDTDKKGNANG